MIEDHEVVGARIRERTEEHGFDHREDRGVRADTEREGQQRGDREGRLANQLAECVADEVEEHVKALRLLRFGDGGVRQADGVGGSRR